MTTRERGKSPSSQPGQRIAALIERASIWQLAGAVVAWTIAVALVVLVAFRWPGPSEEGFVYERYNDSIVAGDIGAAWGLGCASSRSDVAFTEFEDLVKSALSSTGHLQSWRRLRGGPLWVGTRAEEKRNPSMKEEFGQACVVLGGNPLGDPF